MFTLLPIIFIITAGVLISFLWADIKKDEKMAKYYEEVCITADLRERTDFYEYKSDKGGYYEIECRRYRKCS